MKPKNSVNAQREKKDCKRTASIVVYRKFDAVLKELIDRVSQVVFKLYVVDNTEPTGLEALRQYCLDRNTQYIADGTNRGYGGGHNVAIRLALGTNSTVHFVLNPDITILDREPFTVLATAMDADSRIVALMPSVKYPDGKRQWLGRNVPTPFDIMLRLLGPIVRVPNPEFELTHVPEDVPRLVPLLSGCFMAVRVEALRETGLFDEQYFMYFEDYDLSRRLLKTGFVGTWPHAEIGHKYSTGGFRSFRLTWYYLRAAVRYFRKWGFRLDSLSKAERRKAGLPLNLFDTDLWDSERAWSR